MKKHGSVVAGFLGAALFAALAHLFTGAFAVQNELVPPTSGVFTGVQFSQKIGDAFRSIAGCNKGSTAPANVDSGTVDGHCWIDDSTSPWTIKRYVNGGWAVEGSLDPSASAYVGVIGGGAPATISAGSTVDLGSAPQANVLISGSASISSFGGSALAGVVKIIRFDNASTLVNSNSLTVPGGFSLTTANGDRAVVTHLGSGNWEVTSYTRASGVGIDVSSIGEAKISFSAAVPSLHLAGDGSAISRTTYPAYLAKATRAQNGTRTSGNATITSVADTSMFGVGMPVEGTGIGSSCTIASFVANTSITLNSSACVTSGSATVGTITVFLTGYGSGGSSSTVGLPDCTGRVLAGIDPSGSRLTSTYFGSGAGGPTAMMGSGGTQSQTLAIGNINSFTPTGSASSSFSGGNAPVPQQGFAGTGSPVTSSFSQGSNNGGGTQLNVSVTGSVSTSVTMNSLGSGTPHAILPPMVLGKCIVRVIP